MRKIVKLVIAMPLIALTFMSSSVFAQYIEAPVGTTHEDTSLWFGKAVRNIQGDYLGTVESFARDSDGKVSFAIVSHKFLFGLREQKVAIPLRDLTYNAEKQYYTCGIGLLQASWTGTLGSSLTGLKTLWEKRQNEVLGNRLIAFWVHLQERARGISSRSISIHLIERL
jgi:hypothetical protein